MEELGAEESFHVGAGAAGREVENGESSLGHLIKYNVNTLLLLNTGL